MGHAGKLLRTKRNQLDLSCSDISGSFNPSVSVQFICNVEKGRTPVPMDRAVDWCKALSIDSCDLIEAMALDYADGLRKKIGVPS
jgi:hypothetical protein